MAKEQQLSIYAHPSIYEPAERKMKIYFSEPEQGVNSESGILLFIPGFGGNANSNVYKKMRNQFADQYNLITVQCDYFGWEFMQSDNLNLQPEFTESDMRTIFTAGEVDSIRLDASKLIQICSLYNEKFNFKVNSAETAANFNDMGIMQAIDNITAVLVVKAILDDNNLVFNTGKILIYGQSQGAYLSYLCNALAPQLFSMIIDNSAWLFPEYMKSERHLYCTMGKSQLNLKFDYLAKKIVKDQDILFLPSLYKKFENQCQIICFHGTDDNFNNFFEKEKFCNNIKRCTFKPIAEKDVDGEIFKSTNHGLDADFLELFDFAYEQYFSEIKTDKLSSLSPTSYKTKNAQYNIKYDTGIPRVEIKIL